MELSYLSYLENVKVEIYLAGVLIKTGYTDALGTYKTYVAAGDYIIVLSKDGYSTITKTETITRPSEIMVNLPTKQVIMGVSGMVKLFMGDHVVNPTITTIPTMHQKLSKKTLTITTIPSLTII
jgi:hypothetical protein